jgi:FKBP-type peptidyl-prolyl cis-trans isomerase FklB
MGSLNKWLKKLGSFIALMTLAVALSGCEAPETATESADEADATGAPAPAAGLEGDVAKASYSLGFTMAENLIGNFADSIDEEAFVKGARDRFADRERAVSMEDARASLNALAAKQQEALAGRAEENQAAGEAFLAENGAREGVVTLPSGLQYEILVAAEGVMPEATDTVTTHYHGTLIDGTVFDSSYDRGQPASFPLNGVIPGWTEGLQLMAIGAKWRLYIPPDLAYGEQDRGPIPANSTLIFDVELLEIAGKGGDAEAAEATEES